MRHFAPIRPRVIYVLIVPFLILTACQKKGADPHAKFIYTKNCSQTACELTFLNQSDNADSYKWDFGDGQTSVDNANSVKHVYSIVKDYYIVSLQAINVSKGADNTFKDTAYLIDNPICESIGSFTCAKKLQSGLQVKDRFVTDQRNNYYYLVTPRAGVINIKLDPVPTGGAVYVYLLSEARDNSPTIKYAYGYPGETIQFWAGPVAKDSMFIKVSGSNEGGEYYGLTYTFNEDDANELNNSFAQATFLPLNGSKTGTILAANDDDYFRFSLQHAGAVDLTLDPVPAFANNAYLYMYVYDQANSNSMLANSSARAGETLKLSVGPLDTGSHYVLLQAGSSQSPDKYTLSIKFDENDLNEYNNTFSKATPIVSNSPLKGTIKAKGDLDYFKFVAIANAPAVITLDKVPAGLYSLNLEVFNEANSSNRTDYKYAYEGNAITLTTAQSLVAGHTYYFKLSGYSSDQSDEQYTLTVHQ